MAPGAGPLPPASELDVAAPVARYVGGMPTRGRLGVKFSLLTLEWLPFPWRFSRQSLEARQEFLREMDAHGAGWAQEMLLFLKILVGLGYGTNPAVRDAIGYEMTCRVATDEPEPVPLGPDPSGSPVPLGPDPSGSPLGDLRPSLDGEEADVAIIGSGAGGAVAAAILAEAGLDVIVLEAGHYLDKRTYPSDPLTAIEQLYRDNGLTIAQGRPMIPIPVGRAVGGTTVINSGTCFRAPEHVLREWRSDYGIDWATSLDPEYAEAEEMLRVTPVDVELMGRNGQLVMEGAEKLGLSHGPISRNAGRCVGCSSCPEGCRLDAKRAMHVSYLPRAVAAGARVRAGVEARELIRENGRVRGVRCMVMRSPEPDGTGPPNDQVGEELEVRARAVILAGGAIGTPELLLRSGIGSESGQIGRNLRIHPSAWLGALFDEEVRGWDGVMQSYYVDEWAEMGLLMEATFTPLAFGAQWLPGTGREHAQRVRAYDRLCSNGVQLCDDSKGRVSLGIDGSTRVGYRLRRNDARKLTFGIARAAEIFFAAGATEVYSQVRGMPVIERGRVADFEATDPPPAAMRLEAFHPMGTARMSADPHEGVTDMDGSVHGTDGLYVADGSLFPSSLGVNPMMTISAMSAHVARGLAAKLTG